MGVYSHRVRKVFQIRSFLTGRNLDVLSTYKALQPHRIAKLAQLSLTSKKARLRLPKRDKPYFVSLSGTGIQLGYRAGSGTWLVRWWVDGREIQRSLRAWADDSYSADGKRILNYRQAARAALDRVSEDTDVQLERMTVLQVFERYAKSREAAGRDTWDSWIRFNKWIAPDFEHVRVTKLTKADLTCWRDTVAKCVKPATVNRTLTIFKACLKYGLEELEIPFSGLPIWRALKPLEVPNKARDRYLTTAELTRLANSSDSDLRHLVLAASFSGARFGDLAALNCGDWDRRLRKICIRNSKTNRPRYVAVHDQAREFFDLLTDNGSKDKNEPMLLRSAGGRWKKNTYRRQLMAASNRAGIFPAANFHMIRHSYASAMKLAGVDDSIIAAALGHASTRMVQEHYGHLEQSHVDEQIATHAPVLGIQMGASNVMPLP